MTGAGADTPSVSRMASTHASAGRAPWRVAIPSLVVQAGAAGAMLTITLLRPTVLTLHGGHVFVLHDPVGLTGDRLLAHLHRALAGETARTGATCRWVTARAPLAQLWDAVEQLPERLRWRRVRGAGTAPTSIAAPRRAPRVAEPLPAHRWPVHPRLVSGAAHEPSRHTGQAVGDPPPAPRAPLDAATAAPGPRVLLLSESDRPDALAPVAAARLLLRAAHHGWATFAVTRQGAASARGEPWRTHLVCRRGALQSVGVPVVH
jgi:hypothetical protein